MSEEEKREGLSYPPNKKIPFFMQRRQVERQKRVMMMPHHYGRCLVVIFFPASGRKRLEGKRLESRMTPLQHSILVPVSPSMASSISESAHLCSAPPPTATSSVSHASGFHCPFLQSSLLHPQKRISENQTFHIVSSRNFLYILC